MAASFTQLRREMVDAARATFAAYRREHPGEDFYAFALYNDDDAGGANCTANTEQSLRRAMQQYADEGRAAPDPGQVRYVPDEWTYSGAMGAIELWAKAWETNEALAEAPFPWLRRYKPRAYKAMILTMRDLDAEGLFGRGDERERVTLLVWITDSAAAKMWWLRSIKELNPPAVYQRFLSAAPKWHKRRG